MEYKVNSLKNAIKTCLKKYGYNNSDVNIIKNLIYSAIEGKYNYFTKDNGAREYVILKHSKKEIIEEIFELTNIQTSDYDYLINEYINKYFSQNEKQDIMLQIEKNSNITKITQKIKYLDVTANNEEEFISKIWDKFNNIFVNGSNSISSEELKYDMVYAAMKKIKKYNLETVIKPIDLDDKKLTIMDSIRVVDNYINSESLEELFILINKNKILSGLLMQNLFDVAFFKNSDDPKDDDDYLIEQLDKEILKYNNNYEKIASIYNKLVSLDLNISLSREQIIVVLIKNALLTYMLSKDKSTDDIKNLYSGLKDDDIDIINTGLKTNNLFVDNMLYTSKTKEDLIDVIDDLDNEVLKFLSNMYVISRSSSKNREEIKNGIFYGTRKEIEIYDFLNEKDMVNLLEEKQQDYSEKLMAA